MLDENSKWVDNVSCKRCRKRHPALWSCEKAAEMAARRAAAEDRLSTAMAREEWLDAFIKRAGFHYGWDNLESWARRMAEQAYEERVK